MSNLAIDKYWEFNFSSTSAKIGKLVCLDVENACEEMITGSNNGVIALWNLKLRNFAKIVAEEKSSIDKIRMLTKQGRRCIIYS